MAALDSAFYTAAGLYTKPEANMNDFFNIDRTKINENLLNHNISNFKKINGL
jgi:hypothetical protein